MVLEICSPALAMYSNSPKTSSVFVEDIDDWQAIAFT